MIGIQDEIIEQLEVVKYCKIVRNKQKNEENFTCYFSDDCCGGARHGTGYQPCLLSEGELCGCFDGVNDWTEGWANWDREHELQDRR